jgi:hypothetical protein
MGLFDFLVTRKLSYVLTQTHKVKIHGVKFELRKLNPLDYMNGSKALTQTFDTYKTVDPDKVSEPLVNISKIKSHYVDVFMGSVVSPKITRDKDSKDGIWVENLLIDWDLATDLYSKILELSYGKKKLKSLISQKKSS